MLHCCRSYARIRSCVPSRVATSFACTQPKPMHVLRTSNGKDLNYRIPRKGLFVFTQLLTLRCCCIVRFHNAHVGMHTNDLSRNTHSQRHKETQKTSHSTILKQHSQTAGDIHTTQINLCFIKHRTRVCVCVCVCVYVCVCVHAHTHTLSLSQSLPPSLPPSLSLSLFLSLYFSLTHTLTRSLSFSFSLFLCLPLSHALSLSRTHTT